MIDITPIAEAVLALAAALITAKLLPWLRARLTLQQQELLSVTVRTLVFAAEQLYGSGTGAKKLEYVQRGLEDKGFCVDVAAIEAAVWQLTKA